MDLKNYKYSVILSSNKGSSIWKFMLIILLCSSNIVPCTVVSIKSDGIAFGGTNEDWKDPKTLLTFIAPESGKNGWVRFSYKSRFPQGGMNEHGLWWDATGVPFLDMPESVLKKGEYYGPLMVKIMEECSSVEEAIEIFNSLYCSDQFRAQYLIGDSTGDSVIIEGDSHIRNTEEWQLITNFYHSFPELGGFPCDRYDAALKVIGSSESSGIELVKDILKATTQSGSYPTQYSTIFNPVSRQIHLFYNGNFSEFLKISINDELLSRCRELDIPQMFSMIPPESPGEGETFFTDSVTFKWLGNKNSMYELIVSDNCSFNSCNIIPVVSQSTPLTLIPPGLCFLGIIISVKQGRRKLYCWLIILIVFFSTNGCTVSDDEESDIVTFSKTITGLSNNNIYYWKLRARTGFSELQTETITGSFNLSSDKSE